MSDMIYMSEQDKLQADLIYALDYEVECSDPWVNVEVNIDYAKCAERLIRYGWHKD